jgi:hypothetical protein
VYTAAQSGFIKTEILVCPNFYNFENSKKEKNFPGIPKFPRHFRNSSFPEFRDFQIFGIFEIFQNFPEVINSTYCFTCTNYAYAYIDYYKKYFIILVV